MAASELDGFDRLWSVFPKQVDRLAAEKAFAKALKLGATAEQIIEGAARYARDPERIARGVRYTKHPANWLRDGGWNNPRAGITVDQHGNEIVTPEAQYSDPIEALVESVMASGFRINSYERD